MRARKLCAYCEKPISVNERYMELVGVDFNSARRFFIKIFYHVDCIIELLAGNPSVYKTIRDIEEVPVPQPYELRRTNASNF